MTTVGPWLDDAIPVWRETGLGSTSGFVDLTSYAVESSVSSGGWAAAAPGAWSGSAGVSGPYTNNAVPTMSFQGSSGAGTATWVQVWLTARRPATTVSSAGLPAGTFDDPNVVDVEWEPTDVPVDQRFTVTLGSSGQNAFVIAGEPIAVKIASDTTWVNATAIAALDSPGSLTPAASTDRPSLTFAPTAPLDAAASMVLTLVDSWTMTQTAPPEAGGLAQQAHPFHYSWEAAYRPRYRLIYDTPAVTHAPPLRQYPRSDGLGTSSARRMWPPSRSYQRSNRRAGGYL